MEHQTDSGGILTWRVGGEILARWVLMRSAAVRVQVVTSEEDAREVAVLALLAGGGQ